MPIQPSQWLFGILSLAVVLSTIPYALVGIEYRNRDNGLAYLLFVIGLGVWNGMIFAQLLSPDQVVKVFFLGLSIVGAVLAALGWFLFASTAGVTAGIFARRDVYTVVAILGGLDVILAVTTPMHSFYWYPLAVQETTLGFAAVELTVGYWLHTILLTVLFLGGTGLFWQSWRTGSISPYPPIYTVAGVATGTAVVGAVAFAPIGFGIAPLMAASLSTTGWFQASREQPFQWLHSR